MSISSVFSSRSSTAQEINSPNPNSAKNEKQVQRISSVSSLLMKETAAHVTVKQVSEDDKEAFINKIMKLEQVNSLIINSPNTSIQINITPKEIEQINRIFNKWALYDRLCLLDLWGLDLFSNLEKLQTYAKDASFLENFSSEFVVGYISLIEEVALRDNPETTIKPVFFERNRPKKCQMFFFTRDEWIYKLQDLKSSINLAISPAKKKIKVISTLVNEINKQIELGIKLLSHPNAPAFLTDKNLTALTHYFPNASALNSTNSEKTVQDLITLLRFLSIGLNTGVKKGVLGLDNNYLSLFQQQLQEFSKQKNKLKGVVVLKKVIANGFIDLNMCLNFLLENSKMAQNGILSSEEFYKNRNTKSSGKKTADEFAAQLTSNLNQVLLINAFAHDCLRVLDDQVMLQLYPNTYVTMDTCLNRFSINVIYLFNRIKNEILTLSADNPLPPIPKEISPSQKDTVRSIFSQIQLDNSILFELVMKQSSISILNTPINDLYNNDTLAYSTLLPLLETLKPCLDSLKDLMKHLEVNRIKHLRLIKRFFKKLDKEELQKYRSEWSDFFKEICFNASLDFTRFAMMSQDLKMLLNLNYDLSKMNSEDDLLPDELVDYMELEGIEAILDDVLLPEVEEQLIETFMNIFPESNIEPKIEEVTESKQISCKNEDRVVPKKIVPKPVAKRKENNSAITVMERENEDPEEMEPFRIRRGEKTRKILARLKMMGFIPTTIRRGGTSHRKLENSEGTGSIIVAEGGKRTHIKVGTAKSIEKQVNKTL